MDEFVTTRPPSGDVRALEAPRPEDSEERQDRSMNEMLCSPTTRGVFADASRPRSLRM